ncbi:uncharacterized protein Dsimw501_GD29320 [Drosophila simulans]|nr:uncharacterized protein Dsimw501_GD29320 [Drosophila simulans]
MKYDIQGGRLPKRYFPQPTAGHTVCVYAAHIGNWSYNCDLRCKQLTFSPNCHCHCPEQRIGCKMRQSAISEDRRSSNQESGH